MFQRKEVSKLNPNGTTFVLKTSLDLVMNFNPKNKIKRKFYDEVTQIWHLVDLWNLVQKLQVVVKVLNRAKLCP